MTRDEEETPDLVRREAKDRPRDDNRVEMDILLNIEIRKLRLLRQIKALLVEIRDNTSL